MKVNRKRRNLGGIPTTSTSDISFLMLVFFLATTTFDIKKGLGLVLPPAADAESITAKILPENITKVWININGDVAVNEEIVPLDKLERRIRSVVKDNPDMVISLKTDRKSKYDYMVRVLDLLQAAGAEKISLSTN
ncbi:MAG: biopolymer transporter ExbD [Candidatus Cloacimonetes bacterium]|nr:biopolymer transporter ExbD [Candidatus Cloacimonadota bacterium]